MACFSNHVGTQRYVESVGKGYLVVRVYAESLCNTPYQDYNIEGVGITYSCLNSTETEWISIQFE